jgi:hypothetical protein
MRIDPYEKIAHRDFFHASFERFRGASPKNLHAAHLLA